MRARTKAAVAYLPAIDHLPIVKTAHLLLLPKPVQPSLIYSTRHMLKDECG
jgi:hypothetical protein